MTAATLTAPGRRPRRAAAAGPLLGVAIAIGATGCDAITLWLAPNTTCAEWKALEEDDRSAVAERIVDGSSLWEGVRRAQHAPAAAPRDQLVGMASASITKNCEIQRWSPTLPVKDIARDLYASDAPTR